MLNKLDGSPTVNERDYANKFEKNCEIRYKILQNSV